MTEHLNEPEKRKLASTEPDANGKSRDGEQQTSVKAEYVVAVGASAGGLDALEEFFRAVPARNNIAFVVIQHLSPDFKSMMDELLARHTDMKIHRAQTGIELEGGTIYLMIPRKNLIIDNSKLKLMEPDLARGMNLPIDIMLESLAKEKKERSIAIILSGAGRDGSRGIEAIKTEGGYVMAQDETTAKFDSMPRSAAATGMVDYVGSPLELGEHILRITNHPAAKPLEEKPLVPPNSTKLEEIISIIRTSTDFDFSHYKAGTLGRRIERRMGLLQITNLDDYIDYLVQSVAEREELARDMLIGVTRFFRDPEIWVEFKQSVLRPMLEKSDPHADFRAWVAACSTGEEAYSLAICLAELMQELKIRRTVKIFASDIDPHAIAVAGGGIYPERITGEISAERLSKYFLKRDENYEVIRPIREMIIFARHNILVDAPFTRLDVATCRNMLIYLETPAQKRALTNLHFALKDDGCVFIGPSESLGDMAPFFETRNETIKAFTKAGHGRGRLLLSEGLTSIGKRLNQPSQRATHGHLRPQGDSLMLRALEHVAETLGDPGVLIGADNHLIYSFGDLTDLITLPKGGFTSDISRLVKSELRVPLAAALRRCATNRKSVSYKDIIIRSGTEDVMLSLQIDPLPSTQKDDLNFIVLFKRQNLATPRSDVESGQPAVMAHTANEEALEVLEAELKSTKETLQATIEELETSNEELQSSNEELIASNEELQSTNEELHSVNEELQTVNTEYQAKINELNEVSEDFENLLKSTNIGTIFLDKNLRIRRFTKSVSDVIDLIDHDIGRRIDQFRTSLGDIGFIDVIKGVSQTGKPHIQEIQLVNGLAFMMRVLPFQSATGTDSGVVITFIDITSLERAGAALARAETELQEVFSAFPAPAATVDSNGMILKTNPAWLNIFEYTAEANNGRHLNSFFNLTTNDPSVKTHEEIWETLTDNSDLKDWRVLGLKNSGARFPAGIHFTEGDPAIIVLEDLSDKEKQNLALKDAINELRRSNIELEQFGSVVAHDLKEPLRAVRGFAKLLRDDIGEAETEGVGEHLDRIDSGVARMQAMIDDLLNFATITSDDSHRVEVDFDKIVGEVKKILKTKIEQTGTHITVGELPTLRARPGQMIHVLQNLIDNAIKYRSDNPPDIKIEAERLNGRWKFCVSDNGIGLKEQHREKIFEIFKRLHGRGKYAGTGIGLAIVKKIVNNHGGSIWVESEIGVGSRFFFTIEGDD